MLLPPSLGEQRAKNNRAEARCFYAWQRFQKLCLLPPGCGLLKRIGAQFTFRFHPASLCFTPAHSAGGRLLPPAALPAEKGCDKQTIYYAHSPLAA